MSCPRPRGLGRLGRIAYTGSPDSRCRLNPSLFFWSFLFTKPNAALFLHASRFLEIYCRWPCCKYMNLGFRWRYFNSSNLISHKPPTHCSHGHDEPGREVDLSPGPRHAIRVRMCGARHQCLYGLAQGAAVDEYCREHVGLHAGCRQGDAAAQAEVGLPQAHRSRSDLSVPNCGLSTIPNCGSLYRQAP